MLSANNARSLRRRRAKDKEFRSRLRLKNVSSFGTLPPSPDGREQHFIVGDFSLEHGYGTARRFKRTLIVPGVLSGNPNDVFDFRGHFCFVDTNELPKQAVTRHFTHMTGLFIFRLLNFSKEGGEIDLENAHLACHKIGVHDGESPEKAGWRLALTTLDALGSEKTRMFVDAHRGQHDRIQEELPDSVVLCYATDEHVPTLCNLIFRRLDRLIRHNARFNLRTKPPGDLSKAVAYLIGNSDRLED